MSFNAEMESFLCFTRFTKKNWTKVMGTLVLIPNLGVIPTIQPIRFKRRTGFELLYICGMSTIRCISCVSYQFCHKYL